MLREYEIKNLGIRKLITLIYNAFQSLGNKKGISEEKIWPMSFDKMKPKKVLQKSEDIVKKERDFILNIWPDAKI